jgi:hypothetical protein
MKKVVTDHNLGYHVKYNAGLEKLEINIDGSTLVTDGAGVISVDTSALGIVVVSDDEGNVISAGSDKGAFISGDTIKTLVGEMVASATDGIDYDELTKTLTAYLTSLSAESSDTVELTYIADGNGDGTSGDGKLVANVKISTKHDNALNVAGDGLYVPAVVIPDTTNALGVDKTTDAEKLKSTVDDVKATTDLERIEDLSGNILFYAFKA